jgi:membrane fusion protein (multidrug efflux system)
MRKRILAILGALAIFAAVFFGNRLIEKNQRPKPTFKSK